MGSKTKVNILSEEQFEINSKLTVITGIAEEILVRTEEGPRINHIPQWENLYGGHKERPTVV